MGKTMAERIPTDAYDRAAFIGTFWARVRIKGADECWPWKRGKRHAYGQYRGMCTSRLALYLSLEETGEWDESLHTLHSCNNPICCNPRHLRQGTQLENVTDDMLSGTGKRAVSYRRKRGLEVQEIPTTHRDLPRVEILLDVCGPYEVEEVKAALRNWELVKNPEKFRVRNRGLVHPYPI